MPENNTSWKREVYCHETALLSYLSIKHVSTIRYFQEVDFLKVFHYLLSITIKKFYSFRNLFSKSLGSKGLLFVENLK